MNRHQFETFYFVDTVDDFWEEDFDEVPEIEKNFMKIYSTTGSRTLTGNNHVQAFQELDVALIPKLQLDLLALKLVHLNPRTTSSTNN